MDIEKKAIYKYTGDRIRRARMIRGMSQVELAQALGYADSTTIYKIEKGLQKVPFKKIKAICEVLDVDISYLTEGFDFVASVEDHPITVENYQGNERELLRQATDLLYKANGSQLKKIVSIMRVIIGGEDDGASDME